MNQQITIHVVEVNSCPAQRYTGTCALGAMCSGSCRKDARNPPARMCLIPPNHPVAQVRDRLNSGSKN